MPEPYEENELIKLFEREPMEALEFLDAHKASMRNPLNWTWYWFNYYRFMILHWLGFR